tara:strand:+ start:53 stop:898 length:846 start_codon:yes stop_codon:yes gene_type:complete
MNKDVDNVYENYEDIYKKFRTKLNSVNRKVRKNNFTYYNIDGEIKEWIILLINKQINTCSPKIYLNTNIYRGHPNLEFNYSHTMGDKIILSDNDYNILLQDYEIRNENTITSLIIHESAHIYQREEYNKEKINKNYKNPFKELYKKWGYSFSDIKHFSKILKYKRQNPDADDDDVIWKYNDKYYFINCFYDKNNIKPYVVHKYAYPIDFIRGKFIYNKTQPIELDNFTEYNNFFGNDISNNYTPNEIYAEYSERLYQECVFGKKFKNTEAYKIFKNNYFYK